MCSSCFFIAQVESPTGFASYNVTVSYETADYMNTQFMTINQEVAVDLKPRDTKKFFFLTTWNKDTTIN